MRPWTPAVMALLLVVPVAAATPEEEQACRPSDGAVPLALCAAGDALDATGHALPPQARHAAGGALGAADHGATTAAGAMMSACRVLFGAGNC